ncbi:hypothetical protein GIB67_043193 [Kingdonia uniflora]|uniref:Uncharacterized protein n=1 Tax=Kingdonia uniflora TaxID=39325 RepID=A0A7J7NK50_9MAGN|nr:hypothetical protein GIB67_043193 [Kingdonia uniflora]
MERSNERRKVNPKKKEFGEWGSKCLTDFLESIGKDTSKPFSQDEVYNIIMGYINENKLHHPEKRKKRVLCDPQLRLVFQKQSFKRNKMNELLESHFLVNQVVSEEEDIGCYPEEFEDPVSRSYKRPRKTSSDGIIIPKKNKVLETPKSCFAAIIVQNIKLVYLKRSLIEDLLKTPGTFDDKLMWSFVRIKSDPNDYFQKNPYQLVQVIGNLCHK